jgi:hypothetical protein
MNLKQNKYLLIILLVSQYIFSCRKNNTAVQSNVETGTYIHEYSTPENEECSYISQAGDGGYIILGTVNISVNNFISFLKITKTDSSGKLQWTKILQDTLYDPRISQLSDGSLLICSHVSVGNIIKLDNMGNRVFGVTYYPYYNTGLTFSSPLQGNNGDYYAAFTNGWATGGASVNRIYNLNASGQTLNYITVADTSFGGKMYSMDLYRYEDPQTYYLCGTLYTYPFSFNNNSRLFISKLHFSGSVLISKKTVLLDSSNMNYPDVHNRNYFRFLSSSDGGMVISTIQVEKSIIKGYIIKTDIDFHKQWDLQLKIGNQTIPKSISLTPDGYYLVSGSCIQSGKNIDQPFACKISPGGELLWYKIFEFSSNATFNAVFKKGNSYIFGGATNSFGTGLSLNDIFIMRTDLNGKIN